MIIFGHKYVFFANFFGFSMEDIPQWAYDLLTAHAVPRIFLCSKSNIPRGYFGVKIGQIDVEKNPGNYFFQENSKPPFNQASIKVLCKL